jgi:hypothetical protein
MPVYLAETEAAGGRNRNYILAVFVTEKNMVLTLFKNGICRLRDNV